MWNIPLKNKFLLTRDVESYKKYIKSQYNVDIVITFKIIHREDYGNIISILNEIGNNLIKEKGLVGNLEDKHGKRLISYYKHCIWKILQELGISIVSLTQPPPKERLLGIVFSIFLSSVNT